MSAVSVDDQEIIRVYHRIYYHSYGWNENTYLGFQIKQYPCDMLSYQEIIYKTRPKFILQTGVAGGGSVLYFAHMLDLIGADPSCLVVAVDIELTKEARELKHPRIRLIEGSSISDETMKKIGAMVPKGGGLVTLDSDHSAKHVSEELKLYNDFVAVNGYLVVEDTNVNNNPVFEGHGPGPMEACEEFLKSNRRFVRDDAVWKKHLFSFHQYGWLKRVK